MRLMALKCAQAALKRYSATQDPLWLDTASCWGKQSLFLKTRIHTHDYTEEDKEWAIIDNIDARIRLFLKK